MQLRQQNPQSLLLQVLRSKYQHKALISALEQNGAIELLMRVCHFHHHLKTLFFGVQFLGVHVIVHAEEDNRYTLLLE